MNEVTMHSMLNISEAASIALHTMSVLALEKEDTLITSKKIATRLKVSENHLSKVVQRLVKADVIKAHRGPKGGLTLNKKPDEISLMLIYESIDGKVNSQGCLLKTSACEPGNCIFGGLLTDVDEDFIKYMTTTTLADLIKKHASAKK